MEIFAIICLVTFVIAIPLGIKNSMKERQRKIEKRAKALGQDLKFEK